MRMTHAHFFAFLFVYTYNLLFLQYGKEGNCPPYKKKIEMRRVLTSVSIIAAALLMFSSCANSKLKAIATLLDSQCPVSLGLMGEMTGVEDEGDDIVIVIVFNDAILKLDVIGDNEELWKQTTLMGLRSSGGDSQQVIDEIAASGGNLVFEIRGATSGEEVRLTLTNEELRRSGATLEGTEE